MKKICSIIFTAVFLALCAVPLAGWIFGYQNTNAEKRTLAQMPKLIDEKGINADFTIEFDDYFTDNFAFRPDLITMHAALEDAVFSDSVSDQVIIGKDRWLFFSPTLNDYKKDEVLTDSDIYRLAKTLEIQKQALSRRGIDFIFTVAPNKASVYGQYMPDRYLQVEDKNNAEKLYALLSERSFDYVDLHSLLSGSDIQLYHKLDTHWNNTGAMIGYTAIMEQIKQAHPQFDYYEYNLEDFREERTWQGDLSGMLYPASGLLDIQHVYDVPTLYTSRRPIRSMEDMTIQTSSETGSLNVLMFRDSFANALIPLISNELASITYSRATPYDYSQISSDTDVVILEIVERNLPNMLGAAPILPSYPVSLGVQPGLEDIQTALDAAEDDGETVCISGTALPSGFSQNTNYDIYVRISSDEGEKVYPAFPLPLLEGQEKTTGIDFCVRIEKSMMPSGAFTADIILFDQTRYIYSPLLTSSEITAE